ncbi:hypothetical protein ID866_10002 [Astraeus odoratus]|nr:hypothetical protein ID866_10002 [Astraeus odoratus]
MFRFAPLLATVLLALSIQASPIEVRTSPITLAVAKRISTGGGPRKLLERDQARAASLRCSTKDATSETFDSDDDSIPVTNIAANSYVASVGVGSPPTYYNLVVDTGSSNTWIGAGQPYSPTSSSQDTGDTVSASYGSGSFSGKEYIDTVTLGSGLTIDQQSIGVASTSSGFDGVDGILGIGPVGLTKDTLYPDLSAEIPTVTDNLYNQDTIFVEIVGISFEPTTSQSDMNGELSFGGVDPSKFVGEISYVPITSTSPASQYWGIDQSISYGAETILSTTAGIVDTGTTLILIATDALSRYQSLTGAEKDSDTGLLRITPAQYDTLQSLYFNIGGTIFELTPNGQIWPRSLNSALGVGADYVYLIISDIPSNSDLGFDFINGQYFHERFYVVYDTTNNRVGFAETPFTYATTN